VAGQLQVYGPFRLDRWKVYERNYRNDWWKQREEKWPGISQAKGVYLLSLKNKQNYVPQYVGITNKQGFEKEALRDGNLLKIAVQLRNTKGSLQIHLLAKPKSSHPGFSKQLKTESLRWLERLILFSCLSKNPDMLNKSHRTFLKAVEIKNVTGEMLKGPKGRAVSTFSNAIGF
jgi:hypothetical protein